MITSIQHSYCPFCLKNYVISDWNPTELEPACDCERKFEQVMSILKEDIEK